MCDSILGGISSCKGTRSGSRTIDRSVPLDLLLFRLRVFASRQEVPVHHRLSIVLIEATNGYTELFNELVDTIPVMSLIEVQSNRVAILFTALLLPVLRALATTIPGVGAIVLGDLSEDDDIELHTDILAYLLAK
jgi:hypothetical protein